MLSSKSLFVVSVLAAIQQPPIAAAQEKPSCIEIVCHAPGPFRTCDRPREGAKTLSAQVVGVSKECSNNIISVQVEDETENSLRAVVDVSLGPCVYFDGKVGDKIKVALSRPLSPDLRRYQLACRVW
jgi:hypothetical protein